MATILIPIGMIAVFSIVMALIVWRQDKREKKVHQ